MFVWSGDASVNLSGRQARSRGDVCEVRHPGCLYLVYGRSPIGTMVRQEKVMSDQEVAGGSGSTF